MYYTISEAVYKGKEIKVIFCDISKAYDGVWHKGVKGPLYRLRCMGCSNRIVKWFVARYLSKRDNVLLLLVSHQIGSIFWLVSHKDRFLAHSYFSFTPMI